MYRAPKGGRLHEIRRRFLFCDRKTYRTGAITRGGAWLSLVERQLWEQDG
jgi:hypothetical protein